MKTQVLLLIICLSALCASKCDAQAFDKGTRIIDVDMAWAEMLHFPVGNTNPYSTTDYGHIKRLIPTLQISVQEEFAVHKYVGVGFIVGLGGNPSALMREVNVTAGIFSNFHFYQYLTDKKSKNIHQDKLDIYIGLMAGSGVAIHPYGANDLFYNHSFYDALACVGPHVGFNYYFKPSIALNGQVGFGMNVVQVGVVVKPGNKKSIR
ncbi:MAG: hypothetical protein JWO03_1653 [Bacteroidetes bacterium]|nr:hypothetical protein [Bacteroidota bacterium]